MFCPRCKAEYIEGIHECADCRVALVAELPVETVPAEPVFVEVLATYNPGDIAIIRSILDANDIGYFFHGENFAHVRPLIEPARLRVLEQQVELVRALLADLKLNYSGLVAPRSGGQDDEEDEEDEDDEGVEGQRGGSSE